MTVLLSFGRFFAPGLVAMLAFAGEAKDDSSPHTKDSLSTVQKRLAEDKAVLLDVREKAEWDESHLKQASLLPLSELGKKLRDPEYVTNLKKRLPSDKPIYLHCKVGGRCVLAAEALRKELGTEFDFRPLKPGYEELVENGFAEAEKKPGSEGS